jgi:hypothetical protein
MSSQTAYDRWSAAYDRANAAEVALGSARRVEEQGGIQVDAALLRAAVELRQAAARLAAFTLTSPYSIRPCTTCGRPAFDKAETAAA